MTAGRELLASPFRDALARCVAGFREEPVHRAAAALLDEVQSEAELRVRAALEALGPRHHPADRARRAARRRWGRRCAAEPWFQDARVEEPDRGRSACASSPIRAAAPGPFTGKVEGEVLEALQARLAFDAAHPVASHELGKWGTCAFQGLSTMVMDLEGAERAGEELDSRARGSFWHDALAKLVPELERGRAAGEGRSLGARPRGRRGGRGGRADRQTERHRPPRAVDAGAGVGGHRAATHRHRARGAALRPRARRSTSRCRFGDRRAPEALREVKVPAAREGRGRRLPHRAHGSRRRQRGGGGRARLQDERQAHPGAGLPAQRVPDGALPARGARAGARRHPDRRLAGPGQERAQAVSPAAGQVDGEGPARDR